MKVRFTQKEHVNIPYETDKGKFFSNRDRTFITSCVKELKKTKHTICFKEWHIVELKKLFENLFYEYNSSDDCYYVKI